MAKPTIEESREQVRGDVVTSNDAGYEEYETGYPATDPVEDADIKCHTFKRDPSEDG